MYTIVYTGVPKQPFPRAEVDESYFSARKVKG